MGEFKARLYEVPTDQVYPANSSYMPENVPFDLDFPVRTINEGTPLWGADLYSARGVLFLLLCDGFEQFKIGHFADIAPAGPLPTPLVRS